MKAMITVCGDFGDKYWVSDQLLTTFGKLVQKLAKQDVEFVYGDSMDNAQMKDLDGGVECETSVVRDTEADCLYVLYRDDKHENNLLMRFLKLRNHLPNKVRLVLIEVAGDDRGLTIEEQSILNRMEGVTVTSEHNLFSNGL